MMTQLPTPATNRVLLSKDTSSNTPMSRDTKGTAKLSSVSPWLFPMLYILGRHVVLPAYFGKIQVSGIENIPPKGPVILAPTHRSRWDGIVVPYAVGQATTGRTLRFMVTADEVRGVQGWFIRQTGGFPVDTRKPGVSSLRQGIEILQQQDILVIFPEGGIFRDGQVHPLKPGLARLALQAATYQRASGAEAGIHVVPMSLRYGHTIPHWRCGITIKIGSPLAVRDYSDGPRKRMAAELTADLAIALETLDRT
ncbi:lysophospholipid acyltransferase family protein [Trichothermofontia sp.]